MVNYREKTEGDKMESAMEHKAIEAISQVLQEAGIRFECEQEMALIGNHRRDLFFRFLPGGETLTVDFYSSLAPFQLESVTGRLHEEKKPGSHAGLCVRRITWPLLDACKEANVALFDLDGNAFVRLPGVYIERIRPSRENGLEPTSGTVFSAKAARLVRAFLGRYPQRWTQTDLVCATGLSAGYVSTLMKRLIGQGYVSTQAEGLTLENPEALLNDWAAHYRFDRHQRFTYAISANKYEEGLKKLGDELMTSVSRFAWTGWSGAYLRAPYTIPTHYMAYVTERPKPMAGVFPVEKQGNVTVYVPNDEGVFQFTSPSISGEIVSDAQLYIDLYRMPGRAKEQADALRHHCLDFMRMTE